MSFLDRINIFFQKSPINKISWRPAWFGTNVYSHKQVTVIYLNSLSRPVSYFRNCTAKKKINYIAKKAPGTFIFGE